MPPISSRLYDDEKDFQTMLDLLNKIRPASHANDFPVKVNIEENLAVEEFRANTRLLFDGSQPIGWAYVDDLHNLHWEVEMQYTEPVGAKMVAWGETCIRKTLGQVNSPC